ncbi:MAG TPA: hypothetical protein VFR56_03100 [Actinomycetes bacterium]|nr:hypothetical protein [Actinomycetes bacterium]
MTSTTRAALASLALAVPVAVEAFWLHSDDGLAGHLTFAASQVAGWLLVLVVVRALRRAEDGGRWAAVAQAGVLLQVAFGATYGIGAAVTGEPWERVFVFFLLGFLLLTVGGVAWGRRLLRSGSREAGLGLVLVGVLGFLALAVGDTWWHDVMLLGSYAAWVLVGVGTDRSVRGAAPGRPGRPAGPDPRRPRGSGRPAREAVRRP